jgi:hypothetical protein
VLLLGTQRLDLPLPGSPCRLHTDAAAAVPLRCGPDGRAALAFSVPPDLVVRANAQVVVLDASAVLSSSDAVGASCPP